MPLNAKSLMRPQLRVLSGFKANVPPAEAGCPVSVDEPTYPASVADVILNALIPGAVRASSPAVGGAQRQTNSNVDHLLLTQQVSIFWTSQLRNRDVDQAVG